MLAELRVHLTDVIKDIRETLYDLRTDVTDERDLGTTIREHLARVEHRSGLRTEVSVDAAVRPAAPAGARAVADRARGDHQRRAPRAGRPASR